MAQTSEQAIILADKMEFLAKKLTSSVETIREDKAQGVAHDFTDIIDSADALLLELKGPMDHIMDLMVGLSKFVAMRLFIKWGLFDKIPAEEAISYEDLAKGIGADTGLIARFGAALVANGVLRQVDGAKVAHTAQSKALLNDSPLKGGVCLGYDTQLKSMAKLASYFDTFGLHEPVGKYNTPIAFAAGDASLTVWEHVNSNPEEKKNFMLAMVAMANKHITIGNYDFSWAVAKAAANPDRPLVVDVGGGQGHALQEIVDANPGLAMERCVLEDLAPVLEQAKANAKGSIQRARFVSLDFHSEQPVKGALVYYIRRCLHDYGDDDCVDILKQISDAMAADSRVLIVENVLGVPATPSAVGNDIFMMMLGGKERTMQGFESIMTRAGLEVEKLWRFKGTEYAVVEGRKV